MDLEDLLTPTIHSKTSQSNLLVRAHQIGNWVIRLVDQLPPMTALYCQRVLQSAIPKRLRILQVLLVLIP